MMMIAQSYLWLSPNCWLSFVVWRKAFTLIRRQKAALLAGLLKAFRSIRSLKLIACTVHGGFRQVNRMQWKLLVLSLWAFAASANAQVRVWEGVLELPVYEEGAPDPNPSFDQFSAA